MAGHIEMWTSVETISKVLRGKVSDFLHLARKTGRIPARVWISILENKWEKCHGTEHVFTENH